MDTSSTGNRGVNMKMIPHEIRYYKGKLPVKVIQKSKKNWLVQEMGIHGKMFFVTVPRLLWKNQDERKEID